MIAHVTGYPLYAFHMNGHIIKNGCPLCTVSMNDDRNDDFLCFLFLFFSFLSHLVSVYILSLPFRVASKIEECRLPFDMYGGPPQQSEWPFI